MQGLITSAPCYMHVRKAGHETYACIYIDAYTYVYIHTYIVAAGLSTRSFASCRQTHCHAFQSSIHVGACKSDRHGCVDAHRPKHLACPPPPAFTCGPRLHNICYCWYTFCKDRTSYRETLRILHTCIPWQRHMLNVQK